MLLNASRNSCPLHTLTRQWKVPAASATFSTSHQHQCSSTTGKYTPVTTGMTKHTQKLSNTQATLSRWNHHQVETKVKYCPINKLLIANRGEIACRVMQTAKRLGIQTVAVYSDVDKSSLHVAMADEAYNIGGAAPQSSYLRGEAILDVAARSGAGAVHPGYGFLSENAEFAEACAAAGVLFVGPPPQAIRDMGIKSTSKRIMSAAGVPVVGGYHGDEQSDERLYTEAQAIGFPVMIKAVRGGGGKGMRIAMRAEEFQEQLESARREATKSFNDDVMLVEKFVQRPRHVEVQVFGDQHDNYVYLYERDCSVQRRHQKIVEEAPAPGISASVRESLGKAAVQAARAVHYVGAGTVEFIVDTNHEFFFMEMNTRLQVEHPVTEMITGTDLVEWQLRVASGEPLPLRQEDIPMNGHSFEARVYAEEPGNSFLPGAGPLTRLIAPATGPNLRIETGVREGDEVSVHYDPMIAKVVVWGRNRATALNGLAQALADYNVVGLNTNVDFMLSLLRHPEFQAGNVHTDFIDEHREALFPNTPLQSSQACQAVLALLLSEHSEGRALGTGQAGLHSTSAFTPQALPGRHRLNHDRPHTLTLMVAGGDDVLVSLANSTTPGSYVMSVGGAGATEHLVSGRLEAVEGGAQELVADVDGVISRTRIVFDGRDVYLFSKMGVRRLSLAPPKFLSKLRSMGGKAGGGGGAVAPMPGVVEKVMVKVGQRVEAGDPLIIIIAMKMEFVIKAGAAGEVTAVLHDVGATVAKDAPLVTVKPDEEEKKDDEDED